METPIFTRLILEKKIEKTPTIKAIRRHSRTIIFIALAKVAEQSPFYIFTAFIFAYGMGTLKVSRDFLFTAVLAASALSLVSVPLCGHISDQIGRKNMYMLGAITTGIFGFVYFSLLNTGSLMLGFLAVMLSLIPHSMMYGPQAALFAESFTGRLRYSGASLGCQLACLIAGGPAPLIATALMTDHTGQDIEAE
jgi:MFS family permease